MSGLEPYVTLSGAQPSRHWPRHRERSEAALHFVIASEAKQSPRHFESTTACAAEPKSLSWSAAKEVCTPSQPPPPIPRTAGIRARLYDDAGLSTPEQLAQWDPWDLRGMLAAFVERTGFDGIAPLPQGGPAHRRHRAALAQDPRVRG